MNSIILEDIDLLIFEIDLTSLTTPREILNAILDIKSKIQGMEYGSLSSSESQKALESIKGLDTLAKKAGISLEELNTKIIELFQASDVVVMSKIKGFVDLFKDMPPEKVIDVIPPEFHNRTGIIDEIQKFIHDNPNSKWVGIAIAILILSIIGLVIFRKITT